MRKINLLAVLLIIVFAACKKDNGKSCPTVTITAPDSEVAALQAYLDDNSITATKDPRGFFYIIHAAGDKKPGVCDVITINYTGTLTNGTQFDAANNATFYLGQLIAGWQEGLPLIGTGGSITLYIPPSLGYGNTAYHEIPANSNLIFDIELNGVN